MPWGLHALPPHPASALRDNQPARHLQSKQLLLPLLEFTQDHENVRIPEHAVTSNSRLRERSPCPEEDVSDSWTPREDGGGRRVSAGTFFPACPHSQLLTAPHEGLLTPHVALSGGHTEGTPQGAVLGSPQPSGFCNMMVPREATKSQRTSAEPGEACPMFDPPNHS